MSIVHSNGMPLAVSIILGCIGSGESPCVTSGCYQLTAGHEQYMICTGIQHIGQTLRIHMYNLNKRFNYRNKTFGYHT